MGLSGDRACRIVVRGSKAKRLAGISNANVTGLSMLLGRVEKATDSWKSPIPAVMITGSPHWHPAIQLLTL
jgi:hypothetical protein